ncbi:MAG: sulfotransferase [Pseudomonadota bacterium]
MQTSDPLPNGYVIVTGHGRSGSNMLLDILNEHPRTLCRNEPDAMENSPMRALPDGFFDGDMGPGFPDALRDTLTSAMLRTSVRDHFGLKDKIWFRSTLRARLGQELVRNKHTRRILAAFASDLRSDEWSVPAFYMDRSALDRVLPVFKILLISGWIVQSHARHPGQKVLHILREPASFLQSWYNRYIQRHTSGVEQVYATNCTTLPQILAHFGARSDCDNGFSLENLIETELWRWRYMNELPLQTIGTSERYKLVGFQDVSARGQDTIRDIYAFCGLDLDDVTWGRIDALTNRMFPKTSTRPFEGLDVQSIIDRVLHGSLLCAPLARD